MEREMTRWKTTATMGHIVEIVTTDADDIDTATDKANDLLEAKGYDLSAFDEVTTESER